MRSVCAPYLAQNQRDTMRLTVLGGGNTAFSLAAKLSLDGHDVLIWEHPDFAHSIAPVRDVAHDPSRGSGCFWNRHDCRSYDRCGRSVGLGRYPGLLGTVVRARRVHLATGASSAAESSAAVDAGEPGSAGVCAGTDRAGRDWHGGGRVGHRTLRLPEARARPGGYLGRGRSAGCWGFACEPDK